jgi:hypothetical protein
VFENRVLRKKVGSKMGEVTSHWRRMLYELHDLKGNLGLKLD